MRNTANILNTPEDDPIPTVNSSPIYFAEDSEGKSFDGQHGMVDSCSISGCSSTFSAIDRNLEKNNWEMAIYPVEDLIVSLALGREYKRILKLLTPPYLKIK